jgi:hypothetical protein
MEPRVMRLVREMAETGERRAACAAPVVIRHAAAAAMARTIRNARIFRSSSQRPAARRGRVRSFEAARSTDARRREGGTSGDGFLRRTSAPPIPRPRAHPIRSDRIGCALRIFSFERILIDRPIPFDRKAL